MKVKDAGRRAFTLIELMIVVIIVAILAAAAVPIYNSFTSRAYGTEVQTALSTLRTAQRTYKAAHGGYASDKGTSSSDDDTLWGEGYISKSDFEDMKYVEWSQLNVKDPGSDGGIVAYWEGTIDGYQYKKVDMHADGTLDKSESTSDSP